MPSERPVAASYARTSTDQQTSCDTQLAACRRLIDTRGMREGFRLKDEGEKGADPHRPAYRRMVELVEERRIQAVVVWKLDRAFRSLKEASIAQELLAEQGVALISCTEPFDSSTPIGKVVMGFLVNMASFETELIRERAMLGYERRVKAGRWTGPYPPYGYCVGDDGRLAVVDEEAKTLRTMHRMYKRSGGDRLLATWLNDHKLFRRGRRWTTDQVRKALTSPTTKGDLTLRGATAFHAGLQIIAPRVYARTAEYRSRVQLAGKAANITGREHRINEIVQGYLDSLPGEDRASP